MFGVTSYFSLERVSNLAAYKLFNDEGVVVTPGTAPQSGAMAKSTPTNTPDMALTEWTDESILSEAS